MQMHSEVEKVEIDDMNEEQLIQDGSEQAQF